MTGSIATALLEFTGAATLSTMVPGADTLLVLRAAAEKPRSGVRAAAGIALGCLTWGLLTAIGVTALISRHPVLATLLQWAGGIYLIYLGSTLITSALRRHTAIAAVTAPEQRAPWFRRAYTTNMLNPKVGLFYLAILPSFATVSARPGLFALLLSSIHAATAILWMSLLSVATGHARHWMTGRRWAAVLEALAGSALLAVGIGFIVELV